jgi:hypothetical protein
MLMNILKAFKYGCRTTANGPMIISVLAGPIIIIVLLKLFFPVFSGFIYSKTGFQVSEYYSLIAITFVCIVPALTGMLYLNILRKDKNFQSSHGISNLPEEKGLLFMRMMIPAFLSFVLVWLTILLVKPVPTEGWLRNIFAACLLSVQSPFVCLLIGTLLDKKIKRLFVFILFSIFLIIVPVGLLLHHPWNYLAFFSPLYWVAWAWIVRSPGESLIYGSIAIILTAVIFVLLFRNWNKAEFKV